MQTLVNRKELIAGLTTCKRAIDSRIALPILKHVLCEIYAGERCADRLHLTATDRQVCITTHIATIGPLDMAFTLPVKESLAFLKSSKVQDITIRQEADDNRHVTLTAGGAAVTLESFPADEFPCGVNATINEEEEPARLTFASQLWAIALDKVLFAVSSDEARAILMGVCFEAEAEDVIRFVATDTHRLAVWEVPAFNTQGQAFHCIIPGDTLRTLRAVIGKQDTRLDMAVYSNRVEFTIGTVEITSVLIEGQFPSWQKVLPDTQHVSAACVLPVAEFAGCVKRAAGFAAENSNRLEFKFGRDKLTMAAHSRLGDTSEEIRCNHYGPELEMVFNAKYLGDLLASVTGPEFRMGLTGLGSYSGIELSPAVTMEGNLRHVLMPMQP